MSSAPMRHRKSRQNTQQKLRYPPCPITFTGSVQRPISSNKLPPASSPTSSRSSSSLFSFSPSVYSSKMAPTVSPPSSTMTPLSTLFSLASILLLIKTTAPDILTPPPCPLAASAAATPFSTSHESERWTTTYSPAKEMMIAGSLGPAIAVL